MRAVSVDDNERMHRNLARLLNKTDTGIELVATATSVDDGLAVITQNEPELLFLDVDLGNGETCFDLLRRMDASAYSVIFITAHNEYYQRAMEFESIAFLTKPLRNDKLLDALLLARLRRRHQSAEDRLRAIHRAIAGVDRSVLPERLTVVNNIGVHFLEVRDILYLSLLDGWITFYCADGRRIKKSSNMAYYEDLLVDYGYFKLVHQSMLVNGFHVRAILPGPYLRMANDDEVVVSRAKATEVRRWLERL